MPMSPCSPVAVNVKTRRCHGIFPDQPWKLLEMYGHLAKRRCANTAGFSIGMVSNLWEGPVVTAFSDELLCPICMYDVLYFEQNHFVIMSRSRKGRETPS